MYRKDKLGYLGASDNMEGESELLPVFQPKQKMK